MHFSCFSLLKKHRILKSAIYCGLLSVCLFIQPLFADPPELKKTDVRKMMDELMSYHVEYKEFSPTIVKRSFKLYIEQFDQEKIYLLQEEIAPFLALDDKRVQRVINNYNKDDFSDYLALNLVIQKAILRAQKWRAEIAREIALGPKDPEFVSGQSYLQFATDQETLKLRVKKQLLRIFLSEKRFDDTSTWSAQQRAQVFTFWEKHLQRYEKAYLLQDQKGALLTKGNQEHFFAMHILKAFGRSLDAHTDFFTPEEAFEMRTSLEKQFEGIGVILRDGMQGVAIIDMIKGGPAQKSGKIVVGDVLVEIDGVSVVGLAYEEVLAKLKGKGGKEVRLGLKRFDANKEGSIYQVDLKRERIVMQDDRLQTDDMPFGDGLIGKLTLSSFYESGTESSCEKDLREAIRSLKQKGNLKGLVLDLRENTGGFLNQAVKVVGLFISSGVIVISKYAEGEVQYLRDIDGRVYYNGPLVVLTSKVSASAAEIVAQALQDYGAALVVGDERTYGKGTIQYQTVTDQDATAFFKVTVGRYYTVSGRSTQIEGVKGDIHVPTIYAPYNIGERFLEFPLSSDQVPAAYIDPLSDLDPKSKRWFQKNYLPNLQKKESNWVKMLSTLKTNSGFRLEHDANFKLFLENSASIERASNRRNAFLKTNWGIEDLQMREAINILRDMIEMNEEHVEAQTGTSTNH